MPFCEPASGAPRSSCSNPSCPATRRASSSSAGRPEINHGRPAKRRAVRGSRRDDTLRGRQLVLSGVAMNKWLGFFTPPLLLALAATPANAQPGPRPAQPAPAAQPAADEPLEPKLPEVDDPMLKPMESAKLTLKSWQEALRLARNQSTALATSNAQIELAEGQSRQTLARSLPTLTGTGAVTRHLLYGDGEFRAGTTVIPLGKIPDPGTTWRAGLALKVPVFAPSAWYDYGTSRRNIRAQKLSYS